MMEGPGADSEEKREPVSDIGTAAADSLKVLDPKRPIREADMVKPAQLVHHFDICPGGQLDDCAVLKRLQKCLSLATGSRQ